MTDSISSLTPKLVRPRKRSLIAAGIAQRVDMIREAYTQIVMTETDDTLVLVIGSTTVHTGGLQSLLAALGLVPEDDDPGPLVFFVPLNDCRERLAQLLPEVAERIAKFKIRTPLVCIGAAGITLAECCSDILGAEEHLVSGKGVYAPYWLGRPHALTEKVRALGKEIVTLVPMPMGQIAVDLLTQVNELILASTKDIDPSGEDVANNLDEETEADFARDQEAKDAAEGFRVIGVVPGSIRLYLFPVHVRFKDCVVEALKNRPRDGETYVAFVYDDLSSFHVLFNEPKPTGIVCRLLKRSAIEQGALDGVGLMDIDVLQYEIPEGKVQVVQCVNGAMTMAAISLAEVDTPAPAHPLAN